MVPRIIRLSALRGELAGLSGACFDSSRLLTIALASQVSASLIRLPARPRCKLDDPGGFGQISVPKCRGLRRWTAQRSLRSQACRRSGRRRASRENSTSTAHAIRPNRRCSREAHVALFGSATWPGHSCTSQQSLLRNTIDVLIFCYQPRRSMSDVPLPMREREGTGQGHG